MTAPPVIAVVGRGDMAAIPASASAARPEHGSVDIDPDLEEAGLLAGATSATAAEAAFRPARDLSDRRASPAFRTRQQESPHDQQT